jgi:exonuclease VII small subunit
LPYYRDLGSKSADPGSCLRDTKHVRLRSPPMVVLVAFLVGAAFSLAAGTFAVARGIRLWRQTKRTGGTFMSELNAFEERSARTERHLSEWERSTAELEPALDRLRVSLARLRVLQDALERAQSRVRWLRVFVPR